MPIQILNLNDDGSLVLSRAPDDLQPQENNYTKIREEIPALFPRGRSFESVEGDQEAELIEFSYDGRIWMESIDRVNRINRGYIITTPIALYHSHVLWSYVFYIQHQLDGSFELSLRSCGPHFGGNLPNLGDIFAVRNHPDGLTEPELLAATGTFVDANGNEKETIEFARDSAGHWTAPKRFTRDELAARAGTDGAKIAIMFCLVVARSYFTLSKLLKEPPTVTEETAGMVERILRGEKTSGCDWTITVDSDGADSALPLTYHVHYAAFCSVSTRFKKACETGGSIDDLIVMNRANDCTISSLAPEDMPVLISLVYGTVAPLPTNIDRFGVMGRVLMKLLNWDVVTSMFPHWEWAICTQALALDKHSLSSFEALPKLLLTVWSAPHGFMPVAKRVAIGVFADMVWLQSERDQNTVEFLETTGYEALGDGLNYVNFMAKIVNSMNMHLEFVSSVRKVGFSMKKKHEDNDIEEKQKEVVDGAMTQPALAPVKPDLDAPTVVPIEDDDIEQTMIESAQWQCTIS